MEKTFESLGVTVEVPPGSEVSEDGSIFGPHGEELAIYAEPPAVCSNDRQGIIEGRCPVKTWTSEVRTAEGWTVVFETDDGELGFEVGRRRADRVVIFWGDRMRDPEALARAIAIAEKARLS